VNRSVLPARAVAPIRIARRAWRRLISMRTALILLFLLAIAAVPGSLLPQRPLNPTKTASYIASHGWWGHFLDRLGMFDVFASLWFGAIYVLLFISLIGCLTPRIRQHAKAVRSRPLPAPKNLSRLPESATFTTTATPDEFAAAARERLGRRWRVVRREEPGGVVTLSAEKGYTRETGNLIFHIALVIALVAIAVGRLYGYQGSRVVLQGPDQGFCNTVSQYDSWSPGRFAEDGRVSPAPFCITQMSKFVATYTQAGEPSQFTADIDYQRSVNAPIKHAKISVNHPLRLEGDRVYLISHGFAPQITVHMPDGTTRQVTAVFIPTNATTLLSEGAFKEAGAIGGHQDIGIEGFFAPTPVTADGGAIGPNSIITSASPQVVDPVLGIIVYKGDLGTNAQSVYSLDPAQKATGALTQIGTANLQLGQTVNLAGGVSVTFNGWIPWAGLQVSHDPTQTYLLFAAAAMVVGLIASLTVRRRRVWLRITPFDPTGSGDSGSPTVVWVGGLARSDAGNFADEFSALLSRLRSTAEPPQRALAASSARTGAGME
jgi:cytochrome c biogenesis protein